MLLAPATQPAPAVTSPTPARPKIEPTDVRFEWVTKPLGLTKRHEFSIDLTPADGETPDTHTTVTLVKELPVWVSMTQYASGDVNVAHRNAVRDAMVGSGLLDSPQSPSSEDPEAGMLHIIAGTEEGGVLPMWEGRLKDLPPAMKQVWDAARDFMDDAKVERKLGPGDVFKG